MLATYPYNSVRNMAMLLTRTELIFPVDIDFLPSRDLSNVVLDPDRRGPAGQALGRERESQESYRGKCLRMLRGTGLPSL